MALSNPTPRCLFFDVFGTCVDWRSTVTKALWNATRTVLSNPAASLASRIRMQASDMTYEQWGDFAQEWRNSYLKFTRALAADSNMEWKTVDQHHHDSLREILQGRGLMYENEMGTMVGLWNEDEIKDLSLIWHRLDPWQDTVRGIQEVSVHRGPASSGHAAIRALESTDTQGSSIVYSGHARYRTATSLS